MVTVETNEDQRATAFGPRHLRVVLGERDD
jgi:hypothetical protein